MEKKSELKELHFEESLYLSDSMCTENHNLLYKCCQLKNAKWIHASWFFNNVINVRLMDKGPIFKIFHESDLGELLCTNVDNLLSNSSSYLKLVIVKILAVVCVCFFCCLFLLLFFKILVYIHFRPMFPLENTTPLCTGVI